MCVFIGFLEEVCCYTVFPLLHVCASSFVVRERTVVFVHASSRFLPYVSRSYFYRLSASGDDNRAAFCYSLLANWMATVNRLSIYLHFSDGGAMRY